MGKGKKIIRQAEQLGFKELPLTVLYGRPRKIKMTFSKNIMPLAALTLKISSKMENRRNPMS